MPPPLAPDRPAVYRVDEVADVLRVSVRTVYRLLDRGALRSVRAGRAVLVPRESVEAFLREGGGE